MLWQKVWLFETSICFITISLLALNKNKLSEARNKSFTSCIFFHSQRRESTQSKQCKTCHIIVISWIRKLVVFQLSINWSYNISNTMYVLICKFVRSSYFKYQISEVIKYVLIWTYKCILILLFFMLYLITWTQCISIIICLDKKKGEGINSKSFAVPFSNWHFQTFLITFSNSETY